MCSDGSWVNFLANKIKCTECQQMLFLSKYTHHARHLNMLHAFHTYTTRVQGNVNRPYIAKRFFGSPGLGEKK